MIQWEARAVFALALFLTAHSPVMAQLPGDWPMFISSGNRSSPKQGIDLIDDMNAMHKVWELEKHLGVGKGLYPGPLRNARAMGIEPFYAGASSPIVADGTVYVSYYKPDGMAPAAIEPWRTMDDPKSLLPEWFFSVTADDILLAVDADTGNVKWEKIEKGVGLNRLGHKRAHWCVSPAYAAGRVFSLGTVGVLRAYDAKSSERLWELATSPDLERLKQEHLDSGKLCWSAQEGSSLIVADGVVIVARRWLMGVDATTGRPLWRTRESVQSNYGTPTIFRHEGREYVLANSGLGDLRLIDPKDGCVLWHVDGLGPNQGTLSPSGDLVIANVGSGHGEGKKQPGLYGAFRMSPAGAERLWTFPNTERYRHTWWPDSGARKRIAARDGRAWIMVQRPKETNDQPSPPALVVVVDMATGKILFEKEADGHNRFPYLIEDRLLVFHDNAHSNPVTASYWAAGLNPHVLTPEFAFGFYTITGYQVPIEWPYVDGRLYCRSMKGLICYDLRKPDEDARAQTIRFDLPAALTGRRDEERVTLYLRNGRLTHGAYSGGRYLHDVDVSAARWDGERLDGSLNIDVESNERREAYEIDARRNDEGAIVGTVETGVEAFSEPIALSGNVKAAEHQPNWMPDCTHVFRMEEASCKTDGSRQPLILFVTADIDRLVRVEGFAPRTTKAAPVVDAGGLKVERGRLTGKFAVRYRPDPWSLPLVEEGQSAAAEYDLDCRLVTTGEAGAYTGKYGVAWSKSGRLAGRIAPAKVTGQTALLN